MIRIIKNFIDDWIATIKVMRNPKLSKILMAKGNPAEYISIKRI